MKLGIMQPYFFPYIGYWQLINAVDKFVLYDDIQYSKRGWVNRNRILVERKDKFITLPLKKDSDYLDIRERFLAETFSVERCKMLNRITAAYRKAPYYVQAFPIIEACINFDDFNLFSFLFHSIQLVMEYLGIHTEVVISSHLGNSRDLRKEQRIFNICHMLDATDYINPIGGTSLYKKEDFLQEGLNLNFIQTNTYPYSQNFDGFIPSLSIIDVMMFCSPEEIKEMLDAYTLL